MTADQRRYDESMAMYWALRHFFSMDVANGSVHTARTKFSPITFRLAQCFRDEGRVRDLAEAGHDTNIPAVVLRDVGAYDEDRGR